MDRELGDIWQQTLAHMEDQVLRPSFQTWLKNTRPVAFYGDTMVIAVPNNFARAWVKDKYGPVLKDALSSIADQDITLQFVVPSDPSDARDETPRESLVASPGGSGDRATESRSSPEDTYSQVTAQQAASSDSPSYRSSTRSPGRNTSAPQPLNPKYTFETFVVGSSNRLAQAASLAVSDAPARAYNPLFLYGGSGLGKTHLMQAVAHRSLYLQPSARVVYISSETFANEMINAIRNRRTVEFRERYRNVDVLLVDDIQFLAGKESTQEEFFHTFNALHEASRQIVISSDRPPKEIPTLEERLRSRFEWGLISDIQPPDIETRIAILHQKSELEDLHIPDEVFYFIAERVTTNIRELEGALIRLVAQSSFHGAPIDLDMARNTLKDVLPERQTREVDIDLIQQKVASFYSLRVKDLKMRKRTRAVALARQVAMYLAREMTDSSLPQIGDEFGGRDHTTVMHACEKISGSLSSDSSVARDVKRLRELVLHE